jgi:hypothetical protein
LDLTADTITFLFPAQQTDYFVRNFTSDTTADASMGLSVVAEPDAFALLALGLAALGVMVTTRRKGVARDIQLPAVSWRSTAIEPISRISTSGGGWRSASVRSAGGFNCASIAASCTWRIALGPRAGREARSVKNGV